MKPYTCRIKVVLAPFFVAACLVGGAFLLTATEAGAVAVSVSWNASSEADVVNYLVYWGTTSGQYGDPISVPKTAITCRLANLAPSSVFYLAVKAVDSAGLASTLSEEVSCRTLADSDGDGMSDDWERAHGLNPNDPSDAGKAASNGATYLQNYVAGTDPGNASVTPEGSTTTVPTSGTVTATIPAQATQSGGGGGCFIATAAYGSPMASEVGLLRGLRDRWLIVSAPGRAFVSGYYAVGPAAARFIAPSDGLRGMVRVMLLPLLGLASLLNAAGVAGLTLAGMVFAMGLLRSRRDS
jgi:hypothetical protein